MDKWTASRRPLIHTPSSSDLLRRVLIGQVAGIERSKQGLCHVFVLAWLGVGQAKDAVDEIVDIFSQLARVELVATALQFFLAFERDGPALTQTI